MPKRIQRKRTKGWRMPENAVSVTRPGKYGNPFVIGEYVQPIGKQKHHLNDEILITDSLCLAFFEVWATQMFDKDPDWLDPLRGKDLACFCELESPCHADILLKLANAGIERCNLIGCPDRHQAIPPGQAEHLRDAGSRSAVMGVELL